MLDIIWMFLIAGIVFGILDALWLGQAARHIYAREMGDLMQRPFRKPPAVLFYALYVAAITFFAVHPALSDESWTTALVAGAFLGLVSYATYNLTARAVLKGFPASIVPIDMAWGTFATGTCAAATYWICAALGIG
ncbi:MAG: DUF2177 family protein [Thermoleophilia bacterium]